MSNSPAAYTVLVNPHLINRIMYEFGGLSSKTAALMKEFIASTEYSTESEGDFYFHWMGFKREQAYEFMMSGPDESDFD